MYGVIRPRRASAPRPASDASVCRCAWRCAVRHQYGTARPSGASCNAPGAARCACVRRRVSLGGRGCRHRLDGYGPPHRWPGPAVGRRARCYGASGGARRRRRYGGCGRHRVANGSWRGQSASVRPGALPGQRGNLCGQSGYVVPHTAGARCPACCGDPSRPSASACALPGNRSGQRRGSCAPGGQRRSPRCSVHALGVARWPHHVSHDRHAVSVLTCNGETDADAKGW